MLGPNITEWEAAGSTYGSQDGLVVDSQADVADKIASERDELFPRRNGVLVVDGLSRLGLVELLGLDVLVKEVVLFEGVDAVQAGSGRRVATVAR